MARPTPAPNTENIALSKFKTKGTKADRVPIGKNLAWAGAGLSAAANFIVLGYLSLYATDTLGLAPALIGVLILASAIANGVFGLLAAVVVDRSPETKLGKARPYEFAVIGIWLFTWLLFSVPADLGQTGRVLWVFIAFLAINAIFDTLLRANDHLYLARAFSGRRVYAKVTTRSGIVTTIGSIAMSIVLPILLNSAGKSPEGWSLAIGLVAIPLALIGMMRFFFVKEVHTTSDTGAPPVKLRDIALALRLNKWIIALAGTQLLAAGITGSNMTSYYFRYIVGDLSLQGILSAFGILVVPSIILLPLIMKRLAIAQIVMIGAVFGISGSVVYAFAGTSLPLLLVGGLLNGLALLPVSYLIGVLILDLCTYNESLGNRRLESTLGAIVGIFQKVGQGLAGAFVGFVLSSAGYDGSLDVQSSTANTAIIALFSWLPAALFVLIFVAMAFYLRFEKRILPSAQAIVDKMRAERAEGEVQDLPLVPTAPPTAGGPIPVDTATQLETDLAAEIDERRRESDR